MRNWAGHVQLRTGQAGPLHAVRLFFAGADRRGVVPALPEAVPDDDALAAVLAGFRVAAFADAEGTVSAGLARSVAATATPTVFAAGVRRRTRFVGALSLRFVSAVASIGWGSSDWREDL